MNDTLSELPQRTTFHEIPRILIYSITYLTQLAGTKTSITENTNLRQLNQLQNNASELSRHQYGSTSSLVLATEVLPYNQRSVFPFNQFNEMQSKAFSSIYNSSNNCVISSPTGSGKTVLFELAILKRARTRI